MKWGMTGVSQATDVIGGLMPAGRTRKEEKRLTWIPLLPLPSLHAHRPEREKRDSSVSLSKLDTASDLRSRNKEQRTRSV